MFMCLRLTVTNISYWTSQPLIPRAKIPITEPTIRRTEEIELSNASLNTSYIKWVDSTHSKTEAYDLHYSKTAPIKVTLT